MKTILVMAAAAAAVALAVFPFYYGALIKATAKPDAGSAVISVPGMMCDQCARKVRDALQKVPGVRSTEVSYQKDEAVVIYDPSNTNPDALRRAVDAAGFKSGEILPVSDLASRAKLATALITIEGLNDDTQVAAVRLALGRLKGVTFVEVSPEKNEATLIDLNDNGTAEINVEQRQVKVAYDPGLVNSEQITASIERAGFTWADATFIPPQ